MSPTFTTVGTAGAAFGGPWATTVPTARTAISPIVNSARMNSSLTATSIPSKVRLKADTTKQGPAKAGHYKQEALGAGRPADARTAVENSFNDPSTLLRPRRRAIGSMIQAVNGGKRRLSPRVSITTNTPSFCGTESV